MKQLLAIPILIISLNLVRIPPIYDGRDIEPVETIGVIKPLKTLNKVEVASQVVLDEPESNPAPVHAPSGDWVEQCKSWASQAGVPLNDAAIKLLERESHCNPSAWNASSGAGGIPQALPFSKTGCALGVSGAVCQIKWFYNYCMQRYGSYEAALSHSYANGWY